MTTARAPAPSYPRFIGVATVLPLPKLGSSEPGLSVCEPRASGTTTRRAARDASVDFISTENLRPTSREARPLGLGQVFRNDLGRGAARTRAVGLGNPGRCQDLSASDDLNDRADD